MIAVLTAQSFGVACLETVTISLSLPKDHQPYVDELFYMSAKAKNPKSIAREGISGKGSRPKLH